ncbi:MAG TPA: hypothetical protein VKQ54_01785, partial [Caulobacteraceae bacterium]|nr:hypothetical protein [Caulobacteraceae bacterium]
MTGVLELGLQVSRWAALAFLAAMFIVVLLKMTGGRLNIGTITLGRGQLLVTTFGVAAVYAYWAMTTAHSGRLPTPTPAMLGLLGAS